VEETSPPAIRGSADPGAGQLGGAWPAGLPPDLASEGADNERGKQFVLTRRVLDDFSSDGKFMEEVLALQNRFRARDWGEISPEQLQANSRSTTGKGSVGRYPTGKSRSAIIITDEGSEFKVRYEDEPEQ